MRWCLANNTLSKMMMMMMMMMNEFDLEVFESNAQF